jgi:sec-independent protein translocase protein TatC
MFAVAAVLTPPDIISQTCLAIPLIVLYEVSIFSCRAVERARARREAEEEAELAGGKPAPGE